MARSENPKSVIAIEQRSETSKYFVSAGYLEIEVSVIGCDGPLAASDL